MEYTSALNNISFEFFPPKSNEGQEKLQKVANTLAEYNPQYFSVTYGAGGSTQTYTTETVKTLQQQTQIETAPHISCIASTRQNISSLLQEYQQLNIRQLVVLRGDLPSGSGTQIGEFQHANELVQFIREQTGDDFHIHIAAYPEFHPQTSDAEKGLHYFKAKIDAGANTAITQYFFNPDAYFYFLNHCEKLNISIPIIPGIMPITNYKQLARFSNLCGAEIPRWLRLRLESFGDDLVSLKQFGEEVVTHLCRQLLEAGAPGLHFYTLNQSAPTINILNNLGLRIKQKV